MEDPRTWPPAPDFTSAEQIEAYYKYLNTPQGFAEYFIKKDIMLCYANQQYIATTKLIYSGIDVCANLLYPDGQEARQGGFEDWVKKYMDFDEPNGPSPTDLWVARCGTAPCAFSGCHAQR